MRVLLVHPSALMYSEIFLRLEPLGLERVAAALLADGHDVRLIDLQVYRKADLERQLSANSSRTRSGSASTTWPTCRGGRPGQRGKVVLPAGRLRGRSQRVVRGRALAGARGRRDRRGAQGGRRDVGAPRCGPRAGPGAARSAGVVTQDGQGRRPRMLHSLEDLLPARHLGTSPQVLHRRARPVRVDRVQPRLPLGLLVLQRLDLLRPQLPHQEPRGGRRRAGADRRARRVHRRRRRLHPGRARRWIGEASSAAGSTSSTTWRPAATCCCATRTSSASGSGSA